MCRFFKAACLFALILAGGRCAFAFDPASGDFSKADPDHIRVLSYNVEKNFVTDSGLTGAEFTRILQNIDPDIISFNEITPSLADTDIKSALETILGNTWTVHLGASDGFNRNVLATRHGLSLTIQDTTPASDVRGVTAGLIDLPDGTYGSTDFYVMAVHLKSGGGSTDAERRQEAADAIVNWMRDARTSGDNIDLAANTPMLVVGDTNFIIEGEPGGFNAPATLSTGDIFDEVTYGGDSAPDWDATTTTDAAPYDHTNADPRTWSSSGTFSRLDRFIFTDSVIRVANRFILNTATMSGAALAAASPALSATDTENAADHLPCVVDFELGASASPGNLLVNEFIYDDTGLDDLEFIELINTGGQEINLDAPIDYRLVRSDNALTSNTLPGAENEAWNVDLTGVVPANGGFFVLYNSQSMGIETQITSTLPALQYQTSGSNVLTNGATAIALITETRENGGDFNDALVEAYVYEGIAGGTYYLRTNSTNDLIIAISGNQLVPDLTPSDGSVSRNVGDATANSLAAWTIPDSQTAAAANATLVPVELISFTVE